MKKYLFLILASFEIFALKSRTVTATAGNPLPAAYDATNQQSLILSELGGANSNLLFITTMNDVVCSLSGASSVVTPTTNQEVYLISSEHLLVKDVGPIRNIYCKSSTVSKTAGWISILAY